MNLLAALSSLNRRRYDGWALLQVDWEGPSLPSLFRRLFVRHLAGRDLEEALGDPDWHREAFLFHFGLGLHYGYPECCVLQFSCEATTLRPLGERRLGFQDYVPCEACMDRYLEEYLRLPDGGHAVPQQLVEP